MKNVAQCLLLLTLLLWQIACDKENAVLSVDQLYWQLDRALVAEDFKLANRLIAENEFDDGAASFITLICVSGRLDLLDALLKKGVNLNQLNDNGYGPVSSAIIRQKDGQASATVRGLIFRGADINLGINEGSWPVGICATNGKAETLRVLLENGAKADRDPASGNTALMMAAQHGHVECVTILLEFGVDVTLTNAEGQTALDLAKMDPVVVFDDAESSVIEIDQEKRREVVDLLGRAWE